MIAICGMILGGIKKIHGFKKQWLKNYDFKKPAI